MDIAVAIPRLDALGGAERCLMSVLARFKGHKVTVYSRFIDPSIATLEDVEFIQVKTPLPASGGFNVLHSLVMRSFQKAMGNHEVYFHNLYPTHLIDRHPMLWYPQEPSRMLYDLYPSLLARADIGWARKLAMRGLFPFLRRMDKANKADAIVANSRFSAEYLGRVYDREVRDVIYMGVDRTFEKPAEDRGRYILCVNRLMYEKRVELAIEALRHLPGDIRLKVAGEGPHKPHLVDFARRTNVADRVDFVGAKTGMGLESLYHEALCTIYTPIREPFGLVPLESLATGTPVIGCKEGGFTEVLSDSVDSYLIEPTPRNIADKANELANDPSLAYEMGARGIAKAREYTWDRTSSEILARLKALAASGPF
jgi:glycosyltransferase involved in cell wall biosynthesis